MNKSVNDNLKDLDGPKLQIKFKLNSVYNRLDHKLGVSKRIEL